MALVCVFFALAMAFQDSEATKQPTQKKPAGSLQVARPSRKTSERPLYGWCIGKHPTRKPAQSCMRGLCKVRYREQHPLAYANILAGRKKCVICQRFGDIIQRDVCRPCFRNRKCIGCGAVNRATDAPSYLRCLEMRRALGSDQRRLVVWCATCFSLAYRSSMLCLVCLRSGPKRICHHCGTTEHVLEDVFRCNTMHCDVQM